MATKYCYSIINTRTAPAVWQRTQGTQNCLRPVTKAIKLTYNPAKRLRRVEGVLPHPVTQTKYPGPNAEPGTSCDGKQLDFMESGPATALRVKEGLAPAGDGSKYIYVCFQPYPTLVVKIPERLSYLYPIQPFEYINSTSICAYASMPLLLPASSPSSEHLP